MVSTLKGRGYLCPRLSLRAKRGNLRGYFGAYYLRVVRLRVLPGKDG